MAKVSKNRKKNRTYPERRNDVPVTVGMFNEFKESVDAQFRSLHAKLGEHDARFSGHDARFEQIDKRFERIENKMDARFHELKIIIEEQNARNAIVLDGLTNFFTRQERLEEKVDKLI